VTCSAERAGLRLTPLTTTRSRGLALLLFGYGKLTAIAGTTEYMGSLGLPAPSLVTVLAIIRVANPTCWRRSPTLVVRGGAITFPLAPPRTAR
jgi:uncharacterized membrane protein YphA (DoxX/SURF4 family)